MTIQHWPRFLLALMPLVCAGCGSRQQLSDSPRLVVVYATCSLSKDFISPYDPEIDFTPAFERFGSQARVFRRHQAESGQSGVAYASLFSGTQADTHGVFHHPVRLSPGLDLLTEVFADAGYEAHTWLEHQMASAELGFAQGTPSENVHDGRLDGADTGLLALLDRVRDDPEARVLLVTSFTLTHGPYSGAGLDRLCTEGPSRCEVVSDADFERLRELYVRYHIWFSFDFETTVERLGLSEAEVNRLRALTKVLYEASVVELDEEFGELIEAIDSRGLADESVIAFTSDHGEIHFRENADFHWTHGFQLAPEVLNAPLMIRAPGLGPGAFEPVTRSVDVLPTLAGLAGLPSAGSTAQGFDLSAALTGSEPAPELQAFSHTAMFPRFWWRYWGDTPGVRRLFPDWHPRWMGVGVREGDAFYELRHLGEGVWTRALYDLAADPGKRLNLFDPDDPKHVKMAALLANYKRTLTTAALAGPGDVAPVDEERQADLLRSLGYVE